MGFLLLSQVINKKSGPIYLISPPTKLAYFKTMGKTFRKHRCKKQNRKSSMCHVETGAVIPFAE